MKRLLSACMVAVLAAPAAAQDAAFQLARELLSEGNRELAAVEFRRLALTTELQEERAAAYLFAGFAYLRTDDRTLAQDMLDRAETADRSSRYACEHALLSAERARADRAPDQALYFYDVLAESCGSDIGSQVFARRRAAGLHLSTGDLDAARRELEQSPVDEERGLRALEDYAGGTDKNPALGAFLGLFPGAGYWYSGEVANGFRSLLLNSLFIFGMIDTADEEQWGAFAIISFFELTWYTGSIYGGVDAAHRYNRRRLESARDAIHGDLSYRPDLDVTVPVFRLSIRF